jgi:hypothetical protein
MGANLLITVILGAVFVVLVLWVAVRLRGPRRREAQPQPEQPLVEARPEPERRPEPQAEPPIAAQTAPPGPPTPLPEFDAVDLAAAEPEGIEPEAPTEPAMIVAPPEPVAQAAPPKPVEPAEPEVIAAAPQPSARVEVAAEPRPRKQRPARKPKVGGGPRQAQTPGVAATVHDAYRNIRTWTTSLTPGRAVPAILTDPQVDRGDPTTYRFKLKQHPYAIVKTDLTADGGGGVGPLLHEKVQLLDGQGTTLIEMSLLTSDIGSDETPGEIMAFSEGPWLDDFRELNALSSKDSKRIGTDFRKKFRAKEQVRLKRDFGV